MAVESLISKEPGKFQKSAPVIVKVIFYNDERITEFELLRLKEATYGTESPTAQESASS